MNAKPPVQSIPNMEEITTMDEGCKEGGKGVT
jgi:hypothetical protein